MIEMDSMSYNFTLEDKKQIFSTVSETKPTNTNETFTHSEHRNMSNQTESMFSPLPSPFQGRGGNDIMGMMSQQEPRQADTAAPFQVRGGNKIIGMMTQQEQTPADTIKSHLQSVNENKMSSQTDDSPLSPLAAPFQVRGGNELLGMMMRQEPRQADPAPTQADIDLLNYRMGATHLFDDGDQSSIDNFYMGNSRPESVASNMWSDQTSAGGGGGNVTAARNGEVFDTFDFLVKSLSSANNFVSMLTREQLVVLRAIRPGLLYEFLQEVAKVRGEKRMRRALPNECAFCKNNGENEESYSSHALKDWRGRVLCPVLRAFRCPRCGATGDRAHTIKYCPDNNDTIASERAGLASRRRASAASLYLGGGALRYSQPHSPGSAPPAPASSPSPASAAALSHASLWGNFGIGN